ncbi:MAG: DUF1501 domain-containing protein [Gemmataceae bacterium]|nr:DUF1501 domain-containing protein [Gemmataceae bacterium]MCI0738046.1 DUF1501 domain-containing protein [Gemmataceae bacterium]
MLNLWSKRTRTACDGSSRRDFLKVGALGMGGLLLSDLLRFRAAASEAGRQTRNTSVVWLWLGGGPTHVETFDPKMSAPAEFRSTIGAVQTNVPGVELGGVFTRMARVADKMAFVRSFAHNNSGHGGGTHWVMTGYDFPPADNGMGQNKPGIGSIMSRHRGANNPATGLPNYVRLGGILGDGPSWLGSAFSPFDTAGNARNNMNLQVTLDRLNERRDLLRSFDTLSRDIDRTGLMQGLDSFESQAHQLLVSRAREVFDVTREEPRTRDLYGTNGLAQQMLLARRLCEAGVGFVTIHYGGWDMHGNIAQSMRQTAPPVDHAVSAFVQDVHQRGLENDILLVITGEFGRTPRINGGAGRDHWAPLSTLALSGGGLRMGQVVGESSSKAEVPRTTPITPQDLMATVFQVLGIPQDLHYNDPSGRPTPMVNGGRVIRELV